MQRSRPKVSQLGRLLLWLGGLLVAAVSAEHHGNSSLLGLCDPIRCHRKWATTSIAKMDAASCATVTDSAGCASGVRQGVTIAQPESYGGQLCVISLSARLRGVRPLRSPRVNPGFSWLGLERDEGLPRPLVLHRVCTCTFVRLSVGSCRRVTGVGTTWGRRRTEPRTMNRLSKIIEREGLEAAGGSCRVGIWQLATAEKGCASSRMAVGRRAELPLRLCRHACDHAW